MTLVTDRSRQHHLAAQAFVAIASSDHMAGYRMDRSQVSSHPEGRGILSWIEKVEDLGIYTWNPEGLQQKRSFRMVTATDVLQGLSDEGEPPTLVNIRGIRLPLNFALPVPQQIPNVFPFDAGYMVPLRVAWQRRGSLAGIDFLLGGSSLEVLAQQQPIEAGTKYLTQRCPGTDIVLLAKHKQYIQNYAEVGFQFERLLTGREISHKHDLQKTESLHIMRVGGFNVLFSADVDAVDERGCPVEMKTGNPRYFGTKVMFQMLSSGARTLVSADINKKMQPPRLNAINQISIESLVQSNRAMLPSAEQNISQGLAYLKQAREISEEFPSELDFHGGSIMLKPCRDADLLPSKKEVEVLLSR